MRPFLSTVTTTSGLHFDMMSVTNPLTYNEVVSYISGLEISENDVNCEGIMGYKPMYDIL